MVLTGLGALKDDEDHLAQETRLLYVGMTRARQQLLITSSGQNHYTERLLALVAEAAQHRECPAVSTNASLTDSL